MHVEARADEVDAPVGVVDDQIRKRHVADFTPPRIADADAAALGGQHAVRHSDGGAQTNKE